MFWSPAVMTFSVCADGALAAMPSAAAASSVRSANFMESS